VVDDENVSLEVKHDIFFSNVFWRFVEYLAGKSQVI